MRVIYDIGSNNGDDIPYYLMKADLVVAVEANPALSASIVHRFAAAISSERLVVENYVVTVGPHNERVPFYIHGSNHVLSQFQKPHDSRLNEYHESLLPSKSLLSIVEQYGTPFYIKVDVEGYDYALLKELFSHRIFPAYLSAECHSVEVFCALVSQGGYRAFKLTTGDSIHTVYKDHSIQTSSGEAVYSFPEHSAGPFGNDIPGSWESPDFFFYTLAKAGLGWKDIHVSHVDFPQS